ncbi:uncharacterized protein LOC125560723 [Nematostella vectensis]|uniref:uncharacterized protein LOC125560723 n=1 Tax=Nematostella vectensis TaxID=45351 RepID=UPI0020772058|nr:uncharacterized protein LOC125560723 [Nematostella vectensis]
MEDDIRLRLKELEEEMKVTWERLSSSSDEGYDMKPLIQKYELLSNARENYVTALVKIYETKIQELKQKGATLSDHQAQQLKNEMAGFKKKCDTGFRSGKLREGKQDVPEDVFLQLSS